VKKLWAAFAKDLLVLRRDPVGLGVLFAMPLALMVLFTLIQDGAFRKASQFSLALAVVDEDQSAFSQRLAQSLSQVQGLSLCASPGLGRAEASRLLGSGKAQACLLFAPGLGKASWEAAQAWASPRATRSRAGT